MANRKAIPNILIPCFIGFLGLMTVARNPRFEQFHTVDVVTLLASGACFGVALAAIIGRLRERSDGR